jgi:hypothetical protein
MPRQHLRADPRRPARAVSRRRVREDLAREGDRGVSTAWRAVRSICSASPSVDAKAQFRSLVEPWGRHRHRRRSGICQPENLTGEADVVLKRKSGEGREHGTLDPARSFAHRWVKCCLAGANTTLTYPQAPLTRILRMRSDFERVGRNSDIKFSIFWGIDQGGDGGPDG